MLKICGLHAGYGKIDALRGVDLEVRATQMVALIGSNGAGKSTLLNVISGIVPGRGGSIAFDGAQIAGTPAYEIARRGILHVPEGRQILGPLTVAENLELGRLAAAGRRGAGDPLALVYSLFPILAERRSQAGGSLSGGQQQMLAIGRALMAHPRLLILDEPSLGLSPLMVQQVFNALVRLNREGLPILLVEQNARRATAVAHYTYVMKRGQIARHGPSAEVREDPSIVAEYLGVAPAGEARAVGTTQPHDRRTQ